MHMLPKLSRTMQATFTRSDPAEGEQATYEVAISSESEVERLDWFGDRWVEVLGHKRGEVDMTRLRTGAAVLVDHYGDQVGVLENARIDNDSVLRGSMRFSKSVRGQEVEADVRDGIRRHISVGYFVNKVKEVEERDGVKVMRATRWQPAEVSLVSVPADVTVGVGRAYPNTVSGTNSMTTTGGQTAFSITYPVEVEGDEPKEDRAMPESVKPTVEVTVAPEVRESAQARADAINAVAVANGFAHMAPELVASTLPTQEACNRLLEATRVRGTVQPPHESLKDMGVPEKDIEQYSYARAILGALNRGEGKPFVGIEAEMHAELSRNREGLPNRGGVFVPLATRKSVRTLSAGALGKGAETVPEQMGELIELLRNRSAVVRMGARTLSGLTAPVSFPKQSGAMTAFWVGENPAAAVVASDVAFALAMLAPKTLQATTAYSRQLLVQSGLDVEALVRNELAIVHALAIDSAAIHGLGAAGEPTGIYKAVGVSGVAVGGAFTYAKILEMSVAPANLNADAATTGWLLRPETAATLKNVMKYTSTASPIYEGRYDEGSIDGYRAICTNQVSGTMTGSDRTGGTDNGAVFGNFTDLIIGSWGSLELVVDPFSQKKSGLIEVTSFQLADTLTRHGESFSKATGQTG